MAVPSGKNSMAMAMATLIIASLAIAGSAQNIPPCAAKLAPKLATCTPYLNTTSPPQSCCGPLKDALTNDLACLCSIFKNKDLLKPFNIDINSVLQMPKRCGVSGFSVDSSCAISPAGAPAPAPALSPSASSPTAVTPPATPGGDKNNAARSTTWLGLSGLMTLFLFGWSLMA